MSVRITNAVVQNGDVTITSAQFVVAGGLSYEDKLRAFSTLVQHAAASLDLPHEGPIAAEILYRLADERAGAAALPAAQPIGPGAGRSAGVTPLSKWRRRLAVAAFWIGATLLVGAAALLKGHTGQ